MITAIIYMSFNNIVIILILNHFLTVSRKQRSNEALVDMIAKDGQPFSVVEGFRNFVNILDST